MPDPELKDLTLSQAVVVANGGQAFLLNGIGQGTDVSERIGRRFLVQSVYVKFCVEMAANNMTPQCYRVAIVQDHQPNLLPIVLTDVWTNMGTQNAPIGMRTLSNSNRYTILKSILLNMDLAHAAIRRSIFIKTKISVLCQNPGPAVQDMTRNAIYLVLTSSEGANAPEYTGVTRIRFTG